ncbi:hypothetical protein JD844_008293 [Phrynosoma platyrhinos]|uniref:Trichohyalin-plectin-homology domain-containing protein n=1 Tax=Phrynosoma platyrhinos TaxID=52577 RepID=A0ABQ7TEA0_PHRPL|nr:hypothetical protein JD844_008293 [Phrynosoma platyrhinos]
MKEELKKQKEQEEATFATLWEEDRLAKEKREMEETQKRSRRDGDMINMLNTQRAIAEAQRQEEKRLKEEEGKLMEEERQLMKLEDERAEIERRRKLRECRDMLLDSMKEKMKRLDEEKQEELALEKKILDHVLQASLEDTESQKQRKKELLKEQQIYQTYLAQQMEEEKQLEKEMDKLRAEETAKMWAKRAAKEKAMKDARDALLREITFYYVTYRRIQQAKEYQEELQAQINHIKQTRESEKEEERQEYAMALETENIFQQKLADVLSRPYMKMKNLHPLRRHLVCSSQS